MSSNSMAFHMAVSVFLISSCSFEVFWVSPGPEYRLQDVKLKTITAARIVFINEFMAKINSIQSATSISLRNLFLERPRRYLYKGTTKIYAI